MCACNSSPCSCHASSSYNPPTDYAKTLAASLQCTVDGARQIATDLGFRPYLVYMIHTRWTGNKRGVGVEEVRREVRIAPTPRFPGVQDLQDLLLSSGRDEQGVVRVTEVSARYTELELRGFDEQGNPPATAENFYWEVRLQKAGSPFRRRFTLMAPPGFDGISWTVDLVRAGEDRSSAGTPRG